MPTIREATRKAILPLVGFFNRARLGFPQYYFQGAGGIGDDLMSTTVCHELHRRGAREIAVTSLYPGLFQHNPDVNRVIGYHPHPRLDRWLRQGLPFVRLAFAHYDPVSDRDEPLTENVLVRICRLAGITGSVQLRPYLFLTPEELAGGRLRENQIAIQSSGRAAAHFIQNKEWYPDRFQQVCTELATRHTMIQIGSAKDPVLSGAMDLRGRTSVRESAAILANSLMFIGLEGFVMHLARAVDCRSVIVYGGHHRPWQIGYAANANLIGDTPCSPCWLRNRCDYGHECMNMIGVKDVLAAVRRQIQQHGQPLEVEEAQL